MKRERPKQKSVQEDKENIQPLKGKRMHHLSPRVEIESQWNRIRFPSFQKRNSNDISLGSHLDRLHDIIVKFREQKHLAERAKQWVVESCNQTLPHPDRETFAGPALASTFAISVWNVLLREIEGLISSVENTAKDIIFYEGANKISRGEIDETLDDYDKRGHVFQNNVATSVLPNLDDTHKTLAGVHRAIEKSEKHWSEISQSWRQACISMQGRAKAKQKPTVHDWLHQVLSGLLELDIEYRVATQYSYMIFRSNSYAFSRSWKQKLLQFFKPPIQPTQENEWLNPFKVIAEISLSSTFETTYGTREQRVIVKLSVVRRSPTGKDILTTEVYPFGAQLLVSLSEPDSRLTARIDDGAVQVDQSSFLCEYKQSNTHENEVHHSLHTTAQFDNDTDVVHLFQKSGAKSPSKQNEITLSLPLTVQATTKSSVLEDLNAISHMLNFSGSLQCTLFGKSIPGPSGLFQDGVKWSMNTNFLLHRDQDVLLVQNLVEHSNQSPTTT